MARHTTHLYRLHDLRVGVRAAEAVHARTSELLHQFGLEEAADGVPDVTLAVTLAEHLPEVPPEAEQVASGAEGTLYRHGGRVLVRVAGASAVVEAALRRADVTLLQAGETSWSAAFMGLTRILLLLLRYVDHFTLHGAALVAPSGTGCLLVGPSGSGKSTLAFALVRSGWRYLSDDLVLLHPAPDHVHALRLLRRFGLFPHAAEAFPEIERHARMRPHQKPKWSVDVGALFPEQAVDRCVPRRLVLLAITDEETSRLEEASAREAMGGLLEQVNVVQGLEPDVAQRQMDALGRLLAQCRVHRLHAGRDLVEHPERAAELLG